MCLCLVPSEARRGIESPGTGVTNQCRCWELDPNAREASTLNCWAFSPAPELDFKHEFLFFYLNTPQAVLSDYVYRVKQQTFSTPIATSLNGKQQAQ